jgi:hypothetical protein
MQISYTHQTHYDEHHEPRYFVDIKLMMLVKYVTQTYHAYRLSVQIVSHDSQLQLKFGACTHWVDRTGTSRKFGAKHAFDAKCVEGVVGRYMRDAPLGGNSQPPPMMKRASHSSQSSCFEFAGAAPRHMSSLMKTSLVFRAGLRRRHYAFFARPVMTTRMFV